MAWQETRAEIFKNDLKPHRILDDLSIFFNQPIHTDRDIVIFDEVQACPRALTSLKYFQEEKQELALCAAGSLLGIHLGEASFPVGKVDFLNMYPMSFIEFLQGIGETILYDLLAHLRVGGELSDIVHTRLFELLKLYFIVGGLPSVVETFKKYYRDNLFEALLEVRERQQNLILAYNADMAKHSGKLNAMHIERLWRNIPAQLAREQDGGASKFRFKRVVPGLTGFSKLSGPIDWLQTAGLIIKVYIVNKAELPLSAYIKENFFKLYSFDVGILGAMSRLPPKTILDYDYGSYKGYFAENFVAQEFLCSGEKELYSWRKNTSEVEFLREVNGNIIPIEVKSGWVTQSKSLKVFIDKYKPSHGCILSAQRPAYDPARKVQKHPLYLAYKTQE